MLVTLVAVGLFLARGSNRRGITNGRFLSCTEPRNGNPPSVNTSIGGRVSGHSSLDTFVKPTLYAHEKTIFQYIHKRRQPYTTCIIILLYTHENTIHYCIVRTKEDNLSMHCTLKRIQSFIAFCAQKSPIHNCIVCLREDNPLLLYIISLQNNYMYTS